jgi:DNA primase
MDQIQDIKNRIHIEEVVGSYIQLKKAGRNFKACCPFHKEKTPSFIVSPEKQIAHCFGCHWGGDVIKFVQDYEKVEFGEALETLAGRAGIELKKTASGKSKSQREKLKKMHRITADFFRAELKKNKGAMEYLKGRKLKDKTIKEFDVGWAPDDYHKLHTHLEEKGFSKKDILEAGLASKKHMAGEEIFDKFRGRIMFPIWDNLGQIIAFGGRILDKKDKSAKYLNSPDTPIYNKSHVIYGFSQAKDAIRSEQKVVVVEGYFDVITAHQAGYLNIVASSGTALTESQLNTLKRHAKEIVFSFDADEAGQGAALRSIELAQELDCNTRVLTVPDGKDPDDCIKKDPKIWEKAVEESEPFMEYVFKKAEEKHDKKTVEGKKSLTKEVLGNIARIQNAVEKEHYLQKLGGLVSTTLKSLLEELKKIKLPRIAPKEKQEEKAQKDPQTQPETLLLALLVANPTIFKGEIEKIDENLFDETEQKSLYKKLSPHYNLLDSEEELGEYLDPEEAEKIKILSLIGEEYYRAFGDKEKEKEFEFLMKKLGREQKRSRIHLLKEKLKENKDDKKALKELNEILKDK